MAGPVKRRYDATKRQEQARQTRREILRHAHDLFVASGYGATTMNDIAAAAGVSVETVYAAFRSKVNLLKRVWDVTIGGDDEDIVFHERPEILEMRAQKNLARRLEMYADHLAHVVAPRTVPFLLALRAAAGTEADARAILEEADAQRLTGMDLFARELATGEGLAVPVEEARDVLWATTSGHLWDHLVAKREWDPDRYGRWLADLWKLKLLDPAHRS